MFKLKTITLSAAQIRVGIIVIVVLLVAILVATLFGTLRRTPPSKNTELIKYLEQERAAMHAYQDSLNQSVNVLVEVIAERTRRDSLDAITQQRLIQAINKIKTDYEKIPTYTDISKDSLRRIFSR